MKTIHYNFGVVQGQSLQQIIFYSCGFYIFSHDYYTCMLSQVAIGQMRQGRQVWYFGDNSLKID